MRTCASVVWLSILTSLIFLEARPVHAAELTAIQRILQKDLSTILYAAKLPDNLVVFSLDDTAKTSSGEVKCVSNQIQLFISSPNDEIVSTFYFGLHRMGFLFPHPRMQISPDAKTVKSSCGMKFTWTPSIKSRGFHLHTEHPNEWVSGFFQGQAPIARDTVMWLARNFQNVLQIEMIRDTDSQFAFDNKDVIQLAHDLNIKVGLAISLAMIQQKSWHLLPLWSVLTGYHSDQLIHEGLGHLMSAIDFDFLAVESGITEFNSFGYNRTIRWLNLIGSLLKENNRFLMAKIHVSTNQYDDDRGNYNFLPHNCDPDVGVEPHTVMFYGLMDDDTPMYGRKNFKDMEHFLADEATRRRVWYFPETSYFIGMDIDIPLFLTDYLRARAQDYKRVIELGAEGYLTFTSGQELGYWLFDWNVALQAYKGYVGDEMAGLRLLGENLDVWRKILDFETIHFKKNQLISTLSTSNLFDELPFTSPIHDRVLMRDLFHKDSYLQSEISRLSAALKDSPLNEEVKNLELRRMLQVTQLRLQHALYLRQTIANRNDQKEKISWLNQARHSRESALGIMGSVLAEHSRYPEAFVFSEAPNPTSYKYGYGWTAIHLYYWEREERIASEHIRNPFFMNLYNPLRILF